MDLPTAVIHDILFRLPINSIINVKFVCTTLYKLVSNPNFSVNYSKNSPFATFLLSDLDDCSLYLLEISDDSHRECIRTIFNRKFPERIRTIIKSNLPDWLDTDPSLSIVGTSNGLLCLSVYKWPTYILYICNPLTGECIEVAEYKLKEGQRTVVYGFGFCRSTNNYKVLKIVSNSLGAPVEKEGEILTVGVDDTWRSLDRVDNRTITFAFASTYLVNLNEALHWIVDEIGPTWISTFDFGEETMGRLSHPHGLELCSDFMQLTSINNQLCLVDLRSISEIVVWKMKEYGVVESWTKDMVLDISVPSEVQLGGLSLVRIFENGDMLFSYPSENCSISYNPTKQELTKIEFPCFGSIDYSPSFLSLKEIITGARSSTMDVLSK